MVKKLNEKELAIANSNRENLNKDLRKRITYNNCTIISSNCIGGMIYHDLGFQFKSPTINLFFRCHDFGKFVSNLEYYFMLIPVPVREKPYPVLRIDDIDLFCLHYASCAEAIDAWERRKRRVDYKNIYVIATDRDCIDEKDLKIIDMLPYRKTIFVSNADYGLQNGVQVKGYVNQVGHLDRYFDESGIREYEKYISLEEIFMLSNSSSI